MNIDGHYTIHAPRARVFDLLIDPAALQRAIPGCERLERTGPARFDATLRIGIAAIKGTYRGTASIEDAQRPDRLTLMIDGKGTGGFVRGRGHLTLADAEQGATHLTVHGDAQIGGLIASVGQRLILAGARVMMNEFFQAIEREAASVQT